MSINIFKVKIEYEIQAANLELFVKINKAIGTVDRFV